MIEIHSHILLHRIIRMEVMITLVMRLEKRVELLRLR